MLRAPNATSVSSRPSSLSKRPQPRPDAAGAYALLRRMSTGRWPLWRVLGAAASCVDLVVGVEWLRGSNGAGSQYAVATISPDGRSISWAPCSGSGDVIDRLGQVPVLVPVHGPIREGRQEVA